jgi:hypothetical protein
MSWKPSASHAAGGHDADGSVVALTALLPIPIGHCNFKAALSRPDSSGHFSTISMRLPGQNMPAVVRMPLMRGDTFLLGQLCSALDRNGLGCQTAAIISE